MRKQNVSEKFIRFGISQDMERRINDWRATNRDPETGKVYSFVEACRRLIDAGLEVREEGKIKTDEEGEG